MTTIPEQWLAEHFDALTDDLDPSDPAAHDFVARHADVTLRDLRAMYGDSGDLAEHIRELAADAGADDALEWLARQFDALSTGAHR